MAELNTGDGGGKKGGKVRSKKSNPGVDLTAMVDLAFLLITFFMLTTSLSKKQAIDLPMPEKNTKTEPTKVDENKLMTILIGKDNKLMWYRGKFESPAEPPTETTFGKNGIRVALLKQVAIGKEISKRDNKPDQGLIVNIKASDSASYRNLVDILDEMAITKPQLSAIGEITPAEIDLLKQSGLY
jgi:biopolymer transport protein ExbD